MKHCFVLGTRPEIIKLSPLIRVAQQRGLDFAIVHTNQHYAAELDAIFFKELELPKATVDLNIGSGEHSQQTGEMLIALGRTFQELKPDVVYVEGDTNTVVAGALAASKAGIRLAHVEAGLRSYDRTMPEELNRIVTDHLSDDLFAPTERQAKILAGEGIAPEKIHVTGNSVVDALVQHLAIAERQPDPLKPYNLQPKSYALLTMHRPSNVDDPVMLRRQFENLGRLAEQLAILLPVHPRTKSAINNAKLKIHPNIKVVDPIGYLAMLRVMQQANIIVTDSGGVQEEACVLKVPCVTLRENTERPETLEVGSNILVGSDQKKLLAAVKAFNEKPADWSNPFGDGHAAERMLDITQRNVAG